MQAGTATAGPRRIADGCSGDGVADLERALDVLVATDPADASDAELTDTLVALQRAADRLEGARARVAAVWDRRQVWGADDARSGPAWLAHVCRMPAQAARAILRLGRSLRAVPATEAALAAGEIGVHQARRLGRAAGRNAEAYERDEEMLLSYARDLPFPAFERALAYWEQFADPDGTERDAQAKYASRSFFLSKTLGGTWALDGSGDPIGGSVLHDVLDRIDRELFEADWKKAKAEHGDSVSATDLWRTPAQRRFDALVEMARRAAVVPKHGRAPRPLFTVLVDYPTLSGRVLELANGTVVTPGDIVPWLTEADVERVVFGSPSRVLDVGVRRRLFTGATRRALELRDRHCTGFGCDEPPERCDGDHVLPYEAGGLTVQDNGRLRCPAHHPGRRRRPGPAGPSP